MANNATHRNDEVLLSADQVARICGLSRRAVYDAIKRGELQAFRLCSRLRVRTDDLDAWLEESAIDHTSRLAPAASRSDRPPELVRRGSFRAKLATSTGQRE
jgi:excisionase family DNA binding protein